MNLLSTTVSRAGLPDAGSDWSAYARVGASFDAAGAFGSTDVAAELAGWLFERWQQSGELPTTRDELYACLWFEQRRWRFLERDPGPDTLRFCAALVRALRPLV
jgi:hypothetical protein